MKASTALVAALLASGGASARRAARGRAGRSRRPLNLSRDERDAIAALQAAAAGLDRAAQDAALAAARAAARSADARYARRPLSARDRPRPRRPADAGPGGRHAGRQRPRRRPTRWPACSPTRPAARIRAGDLQRTDRLLARIVEVQPNNAARSPITASSPRPASASPARPRPTATAPTRSRCSSARSPPTRRPAGRRRKAGICGRWRSPMTAPGRRRAIRAARRRRSPSPAALVAAYPTQVNWRDALLAYRDLAPADPALDLDIRRLMRASQALAGERDYIEFAEALGRGRADRRGQGGARRGRRARHGRDRAACRRPLATADRRARASPPTAAGLAGLRTPRRRRGTGAAGARPPATLISAYGQYAEAADALPAALQKGGEDANLVNSRLGAALALAGRRPEAEAALRAVTGPRADLAGFWLAWLAAAAGSDSLIRMRQETISMKISKAALAVDGHAGRCGDARRPGAAPIWRSAAADGPQRPAPAAAAGGNGPAARRRRASIISAAPSGRAFQPVDRRGAGRRLGRRRPRRSPPPRPRRAAPTPNIWSARSVSRSASAPATPQLQAQAIDEMIASGGAQPSEMRALLREPARIRDRGGRHGQGRARRCRSSTRSTRTTRAATSARPGSGSPPTTMPARSRSTSRRCSAQQAAGQPIPVEWRQQIAGIAYRARQPQTIGYMRELADGCADAGDVARHAGHLSASSAAPTAR